MIAFLQYGYWLLLIVNLANAVRTGFVGKSFVSTQKGTVQKWYTDFE